MREVQPAWCVIAFLSLELLMAKAIALWGLHLLTTKAMPFQAGKCIWHCCLLKQQIVQYNIFQNKYNTKIAQLLLKVLFENFTATKEIAIFSYVLHICSSDMYLI